MRNVFPIVIVTISLGFAAEALSQDKNAIVEFADLNVKFKVPEGWKVVKKEEKKGYAWCILQEQTKGKIKPTVALWAGKKYIQEAPPGERFGAVGIKPANAVAASIWAHYQVLSHALGAKAAIVPKLERGDTEGPDGTKAFFFGLQSAGPSAFSWGVSTEERKGGPLTAGCAGPVKDMERVKKVLNALLIEIDPK